MKKMSLNMILILIFQLAVISNIFAIDKSNQLRGHSFMNRTDGINRSVFRKNLKGFICFEIIADTLTPNNIIVPAQIVEIVTNELKKRDIVINDCDRINPYPTNDAAKWYAFQSSYFAYITIGLEVVSLKGSEGYIYVISFDVSANSTLTRFPKLAFAGDIWELQPNSFFVDIGTVEEIKEKIKEITCDFADDYNAKVEWPKDNVWDMK